MHFVITTQRIVLCKCVSTKELTSYVHKKNQICTLILSNQIIPLLHSVFP